MFGWFRNKPAVCPVDDEVRTWLDESWAWLKSFLGNARLQKAETVLPHPQFFPNPFHHTEDDARMLCQRLCEYIDLPPTHVTLHVHEVQYPQDAPNIQPPFPIWIHTDDLADVALLLGVLVRELGYVRLWGSDRFNTDYEDIDALSELTAVFMGLGVLAANTVLHENYWHEGHTSNWTMQVRSELQMPAYGYALALYARDRADDGATWERELRADVRAAFQQAQRYLSQAEGG